MNLSQDILSHALELGFDVAGITPLARPAHLLAFEQWLAAGYQGEMEYMAAHADLRADPARLAPGARSAIVVAANYYPGPSPEQGRMPSSHCSVAGGKGRFARYAWPRDYHRVMRRSLHLLDSFIRECSGRQSFGRACVDTAPLLERDLAAQAGLGFIGRHTCLITPGLGSWTFLAALLVPEALEPAMARRPGLRTVSPTAIKGTCGHCTRCLDACPTRALVAPYVLDARRCIAYLTIEHRGPIPRQLRPLMGNWVFGCDICQEVCPYNRAAPRASWPELAPQTARGVLPLLDLLTLDEATFRQRFQGTAILRPRRRGLVRNACVAAGNWGAPEAVSALISLLTDPEPLIRGHAAWALGRCGGVPARQALARALSAEPDPWVQEEIREALL